MSSKSQTKIIKYCGWLIYGILFTVLMLCINADSCIEEQMPTRVEMMQQSLNAFADCEMPKVFSYSDAQQNFYIVVPYIAFQWFGCKDANQVLKICQDVYAFIFFSVLPLLVYKISGSKLGGGITPILTWVLWGDIIYRLTTSPYYAIAWGSVLSFGVIVLLLKENRKQYIFFLIGIECLIIGLTHFIRTSGIIVCAFLLIIIAFVKQYKKMEKQRYRFIKAMFSKLVLFTILGVIITNQMADSGIAKLLYRTNGIEVNKKIQPWHSLYIGLGFEDNPYGIYYKDECGIEKARSINPEVVYHSDEYFEILKQEYFKIWKEDPDYVIKCYFKKCVKTIVVSLIFSYTNKKLNFLIWFGAVVLIIGIVVKERFTVIKRIQKQWKYGGVWTLMYLGSMVQGIMAIPRVGYITGSIAMIGVFLLWIYITGIIELENTISIIYKRKLGKNKLEN